MMPNVGAPLGSRAMAVGSHRAVFVALHLVRMVFGAPAAYFVHTAAEDDHPPAKDPSLWMYLGIAVVLVLLGGLFAGLTIAMMGQDEIYLQVMATSGSKTERKHAQSVLGLLNRGKHWVLVTLLLSNVITNETLPIILDRSLGGGWPAVVGSTVLIVIFGEILPQSVCVRYGLPIGAFFATPMLVFMWILSPIGWPIAKLLDYCLGQAHGTTYKKTGLKTLITLHRTLGSAPDERLNKDEVTIINAVLDLKDKSVGSIMTPMEDVFILSADAVLDQDLINRILDEGYSRIPIHAVDQESNFVGMLLVKMLITYDPDDCLKVRDFPLATLPETSPSTSCLDIINFFQEGKSHMVLVSDNPGQNYGALGVVTLEDVIEELIGEEIVDESDVFVDIHKAIRRMHPAPRFRVPKGDTGDGGLLVDAGSRKPSRRLSGNLITLGEPKEDGETIITSRRPSLNEGSTVAKLTRRRSSNNAEVTSVKATSAELREHLKHLGPSNLASRPKSTRINTVKIKPGVDTLVTVPETRQISGSALRRASRSQSLNEPASATDDEATGLLMPRPTSSAGEHSGLLSAGREASDGVQALGYGTIGTSPTAKTKDVPPQLLDFFTAAAPSSLSREISAPTSEPTSPKSQSHSPNSPTAPAHRPSTVEFDLPEASKDSDRPIDTNNQSSSNDAERSSRFTNETSFRSPFRHHASSNGSDHSPPEKIIIRLERSQSQITEVPSDVESDHGSNAATRTTSRAASEKGSTSGSLKIPHQQTRSGSITENIVHIDGVRKVVLETTSSSDDVDESAPVSTPQEDPEGERKFKTHRGTRGGKKHKTAAKKAAQAQREAEAVNGGADKASEDTPSAKSITAPDAREAAKGKAVDVAVSSQQGSKKISDGKASTSAASPSPSPSPQPAVDGSGDEAGEDGQAVKVKKKKRPAKKAKAKKGDAT